MVDLSHFHLTLVNVCLLSVIRKQWQYNYYIDQSEFLTRFWTDFRSSVWNIHNFHINQNAPYLPPKILHNHRLRFLLGGLQYPGEIGNNGYAKFGGGGGTRCITVYVKMLNLSLRCIRLSSETSLAARSEKGGLYSQVTLSGELPYVDNLPGPKGFC